MTVRANWVSTGPVQINVGRDFHMHCGNGTTSEIDTPDDCGQPRGPGGFVTVPAAAKHFFSSLWFLLKVAFWIVVAALVLPPLTAAAALSLPIWILGRFAELFLLFEDTVGGGPTQLACMSTLQQAMVPALAAGNELDSREVKQFESGSGSVALNTVRRRT